MTGRFYRIAVLVWALVGCGEAPLGVVGSASEGLVFARLEGGVPDLVRARLSDGAVHQTRTPEREEVWPYWSDVAGRLLYQVRPSGPLRPFDLALFDPETGDEQALTKTPRIDERWPSWSPTRAEFAYAFVGGTRPPSGVALREPGTSRSRIVGASGPHDFFFRPNFSPDGKQLVVQRRGPNGSGSSLWLLTEGRGPRRLTPDGASIDRKGWFTRDGEEIVFTRRATGEKLHDVMRMPSGGGDAHPWASLPGADDHTARPSPTRDEIAFVSTRSGTADIFLASLTDGELRNLTKSDAFEEYAPRWSPNGELLAVTFRTRIAEGGDRSDRQDDLSLMHIRVIDREGRQLFEHDGFMPDWMPPFE
jgi:Tol biopolymer transport system component